MFLRAAGAPAFVAVGMLSLFGCTNDSSPANEREDQGGNPSGYSVTGGLREYALEETARVDGYTHDLVPVGWLGVSKAGTLAVFQPQDRQIRFFDLSGNPRGSFGRSGDGPGEFRRLSAGGWLSDTLWVADGQLSRLTLISPEAELVRTLPLVPVRMSGGTSAQSSSFPRVQALAVYPGDTLLVAAMLPADGRAAPAIPGTPFLRVSSDGAVQAHVLDTPPDPSMISVNVNGMFVTAAVPFASKPLWAIAPDGGRIAIVTSHVSQAEQDVVEVAAFDAAGNGLFETKIPFEPVSLPAQVSDSVIATLASNAPRPEIRRVIEAEVSARVPSTYPPVVSILVGVDGRVWVGLRATERGNPWLVLDSRGEALGRIELPPNSFLRQADEETIWVIERDGSNVESVVRYRLERRR